MCETNKNIQSPIGVGLMTRYGYGEAEADAINESVRRFEKENWGDATGSVVNERFEDPTFIGTPNGGPEEKPKDYFDTPITIKPGQECEISEPVLII